MLQVNTRINRDDTVLVQRVTFYIDSNQFTTDKAQKAKNVCRALTGKGDNYPQQLQCAKRGIASCFDYKPSSTKTWEKWGWFFILPAQGGLCQVEQGDWHSLWVNEEAEPHSQGSWRWPRRSPKKKGCDSYLQQQAAAPSLVADLCMQEFLQKVVILIS